MNNANILWLIIGLMLGGGISFLALCLVAMGKLGDDPMPEIDEGRMRAEVDSKRTRIPVELAPHQPLVKPM